MNDKKTDDGIAGINLRNTKGSGRKARYDFWDIPVDPEKCRLYHDTDAHKLNASLYQFKKKHGGEFTIRTLEDGSVAIWCLKAPKKKLRKPPPA